MVALRTHNEHGIRVITRNTRLQENIERRIRILEAQTPPTNAEQRRAYDKMLESLYDGEIPKLSFGKGFRFQDVTRETSEPGMVAEITRASFSDEFSRRRAYEVDAGRDEEPILYMPIYSETMDANLEELVDINTLGPTGVIFEEVKDGGEVKFASIGQGSKSVRIKQYAVGLEYSQNLILYNKTWKIGPHERRFGTAHNALMNHIHLGPILDYTYGASNQTAASSNGSTLYEKVANTIDTAITDSVDDSDNPRRGPYVLVCNLSNLTTIERAMGRVPQQGFNLRPSTLDNIRTIIAYNGWSGTRGKKSVSYSGVTANKAYLVHVGHRDFDFQSYVKIPFREQRQAGDIRKFIAEVIVYDTHFGMFADPGRAVQEITLPTS